MSILISMLCVVGLVGCSSKSVEVRWDNGVITSNGVTIDVDTYTGTSAYKDYGDARVSYYSCDGPDDCIHNILGIAKDIMTPYDKGCYYYTAYFDTTMAMYAPFGDYWNEGMLSSDENSGYAVGTMAEIMRPVLQSLPLDGSLEQLNINGDVLLNTSAYTFNATKSYVEIEGFLKVGTNPGIVTLTQTVVIGDVTVAKESTTKFDYYQYGNTLIEAAAGIDISPYITFIKK